MFKRVAIAAALCAAATTSSAGPTLLQQGFDNVAALSSQGWSLVNKSAGTTADSTFWQQGNGGLFAAQGGSAGSYAMANYTSSLNGLLQTTGAIENWLITPLLAEAGGYTVQFYARTEDAAGWADGLEVRSGLVGSDGQLHFDTLIGSLNPLLDPNGVPNDWALFSFSTHFTAPLSGQLAFVYKADGSSANLIAIDELSVSAIPEPASLALASLALFGMAAARRRPKHAATQHIGVTP